MSKSRLPTRAGGDEALCDATHLHRVDHSARGADKPAPDVIEPIDVGAQEAGITLLDQVLGLGQASDEAIGDVDQVAPVFGKSIGEGASGE